MAPVDRVGSRWFGAIRPMMQRAAAYYPAGVGELSQTPPLPPPEARRVSAGVVTFAICGVVIALVVAGLYVVRPSSHQPARGNPEDAVREFLGAVFLAHDAARVGKIVCTGWPGEEAMTRTTAEIDTDARVSWDNVRVISSDATRANVRARLGLRFPDDKQPSVFSQWRFSVVDEDGWRVCDARPFIE